jgi:hypothetical protein
MPHPFSKIELPSFQDIRSKMKGITFTTNRALDTIAEEKAAAWKANIPKISIFSFFPLNSPKGQFLQTMSAAIQKKLTPVSLLFMPDLEALASLAIYAQHRVVTHALFACDLETLQKVNDFLLPLNLQGEKKSDLFFYERYTLYQTSFMQLVVSDTLPTDMQQKKLLWNTLQSFVG